MLESLFNGDFNLETPCFSIPEKRFLGSSIDYFLTSIFMSSFSETYDLDVESPELIL